MSDGIADCRLPIADLEDREKRVFELGTRR